MNELKKQGLYPIMKTGSIDLPWVERGRDGTRGI